MAKKPLEIKEQAAPEILYETQEDLTIVEAIQVMLNEWSRNSGLQSKVDLQLGADRIIIKAEA